MTTIDKAVTPAHGQTADPYRIFFPLGIAMGIAGVAIWPLYYWGFTSGYSGSAHAFIQSDCFLYAFIVGFLWTAVPRFTATSVPETSIQYSVAALLAGAVVAFEAQDFRIGHLLFLVAHLSVVAVLVRRFRQKHNPPPETFVLVGLGMLAGLIAALVNAGIAVGIIPPAAYLVGRRLMTEGMVLLLALGVGGFLGPRLLGFAQLPQFQNLDKSPAVSIRPAAIRQRQYLYALAGLAVVLSVIIEYGWNLPAFAWLRAAVATLLIVVHLRPWRTPVAKTTLAWCVWMANWLLIAALWLVAAAPKYRVDFLHVMFIGAFTLLIVAVGTRVALSHGGHGLSAEKKSWPLRIALTCGLIAMLARIGAPFVPNAYFLHLGWAGLFWIGGISIWGAYLFIKIVKVAHA